MRKWNATTGEFEEVECEGNGKMVMRENQTKTTEVMPRTPSPAKGKSAKNPSADDIDILRLLPPHIEYDSDEFPRTIPEAEARILARLAVECISSDLLHKSPYSAYQQWTTEQQQRFRKAENKVALRLLRLAGIKHPAPEGDEHERARES